MDGDLIRDFLELPEEVQERVIRMVPMDVIVNALGEGAAPGPTDLGEEWKRGVIMHVIQNVMCTAI